MLEVFSRIFNRRRVSPERQPEIRLVTFGNTTVGVNINSPEELLKVSTVWRCVNVLAGGVATLPWRVVKPQANGDRSIKLGHEIAEILQNDPNPEMSAFAFRQTMMHHKLLYGNAYAEIEVDGRGRAKRLWPISPERVEPWRDPDQRLWYRVYQATGGAALVDPDFIFHVPGLAWDGIRGYSILSVALQSLGGAYAMDRFAGRFFSKGMLPSGVITVPEDVSLDESGLKRLREEFKTKAAGWQNAQEPLILDQGMKFEAASVAPEAGQFLDTRKFSIYDACRWFGVPPYIAFASDEEPRANVETQSREFLTFGLQPHIDAFVGEANRKMFFGYRLPLETDMDTTEYQLGDLTTQAAYFDKMRHMGVMTVNEIRRVIGLDSIGAEGDFRVMQVQYQPIGPDGAPMAPKIKAGESGQAGDTTGVGGQPDPALPNGQQVNGRMNGGSHEQA